MERAGKRSSPYVGAKDEILELSGMLYCKEGPFGDLQTITRTDIANHESAIAKVSRSDQLDYGDLNHICQCSQVQRHYVFVRLRFPACVFRTSFG